LQFEPQPQLDPQLQDILSLDASSNAQDERVRSALVWNGEHNA
jgi:hypothetical protein